MSITNVITRITVDMAGDVKRFAVKAKQYDRATRVIVVSLLWDEVPYVLDSADTVRCNVHKPDGTIAIIEGDNIAVNGNTVTITLPGTALTAAGRAWADIEIETQDESQQISCQCFEIDIARSPVDDDSIISTNEFSAMKAATKAANDAAAAALAEIDATAAAGAAANQAAAAAQAATDAANQAAAAATASIQIDPTLTDNSKAAPAGMVGEIKEDLSLVVEPHTESKHLSHTTHTQAIINTSGDVVEGTVANQRIIEIDVQQGYNINFKLAQRVSGENKYAFYNAETYEGCSSATLVGERMSYSNNNDNTVSIPDTAKKCLFMSNGTISYIIESITYNRSIADAKIETLTDSVNLRFADVMDFSSMSSFRLGRKGVNTDIVYSNTKIISSNVINIDRDIIISIADGYVCAIYYFNEDGTDRGNTGGQTDLPYRTILKGSRIMVNIGKTGSPTITSDDIPTYISAVTFSTAYADLLSQINENSNDDDLAALMYQRGAASKTFPQSGIGIICAGQSQMDGRVPLADLPADIVVPMPNAYFVNGSTGAISNINVTGAWDVSISLFDALSNAGLNSYRIKRALGDTGLYYNGSTSNWSPFWEKTIAVGKVSLLRSLENYIRIAMSTDSNVFDIRAFVWMQGEWDRVITTRKIPALEYYKNLKCLVAYVRGVVGNPYLPFICGTVSHLSSQYDSIVEEATLRVCEEDDFATCIDMSGAPLLSDGVHLNADSAVYFGRMAFDALIDFGVISAEKLNPTRPW